MNFERTNAQDGIHENIEFNEYHNSKWWSERRLRRELIDKLAPFAIVVFTVAAFCIIGIIEDAL